MQATNIEHAAQPATAHSETQSDLSIEDVALRQSFEAPYINASIVEELHDHILRCWREYCQEDSTRQRSPYIQLMQSRGFGKSRLLRELTERMGEDQATDYSMRLLYVCAAKNDQATTYPHKTEALYNFFFPAQKRQSRLRSWANTDLMQQLATRLVDVYNFATLERTDASASWKMIGRDWLQQLMDNERLGEELVRQLQNQATSERYAAVHSSELSHNRVLILAVDDADYVWPRQINGMLDWSHMLRRALVIANQEIQQRFGPTCGVFAILTAVDAPTTSPLASLTGTSTPSIVRPSVKPFAPFILTHTMDLFHKQAFDQWKATPPSTETQRRKSWGPFHQAMILRQDRDLKYSKQCLLEMGRPLWRSLFPDMETSTESDVAVHFDRVVSVATQKLLNCDTVPDDLTDVNMFGAASLVCCTNLQVHPASDEALRFIGDHMAILVDGTHGPARHDRDLRVCSYLSDPILALGAVKVWSQGVARQEDWLATKIIPAIYKMIFKQSLITKDVNVLVSQILLLLVMDASRASADWVEFTDVTRFVGNLPPLGSPSKTANPSSSLEAQLLAKWSTWKLGFTHFLQLDELPNETVLWCMLARRAAGVFPSRHKGMELFIPIFTSCNENNKPAVSMILIQVQGQSDDSNIYSPYIATQEMRPWFLSESSPYFESLRPDQVLRAVLRVHQGTQAAERQCIAFESEKVLFIDGVAAWKRGAVEVVTKACARRMKRLLELNESPWQWLAVNSSFPAADTNRSTLSSRHDGLMDALLFGENTDDSVPTRSKRKLTSPDRIDGDDELFETLQPKRVKGGRGQQRLAMSQ